MLRIGRLGQYMPVIEIEFDENARSARQAANYAMDHLKAAGCWRSSFDAQGLPAIFMAAANSSRRIDFSDGTTKTPLQALTALIERVSPKIVNGMVIDPESVRRDAIVRELMNAHSVLTYGEALTHVNHIKFDDMPDGPIRPALVMKADQRSANQNIPFAKALLQVLDETEYPWQQDKTLSDLNTAYGKAPLPIEAAPGQKQIDPAQFTALAQERAKSEGIPFEKALKQIQLENHIESTWGAMRPHRTELNV